MHDESPPVTPNRRGVRSRELVLDAAERVMSTEGFEAATIARVVEVAGVPLSSVYHYYGSKDGVLLAVMHRGAERFFADLPTFERRRGTAVEHLRTVLRTTVHALEGHPDFLRLLIVFAVQPPSAGDGEIAAVVREVRHTALARLGQAIAMAFGEDEASDLVRDLSRVALALIDGAFVAARADPTVEMGALLAPLPEALVAVRRSRRAD